MKVKESHCYCGEEIWFQGRYWIHKFITPRHMAKPKDEKFVQERNVTKKEMETWNRS